MTDADVNDTNLIIVEEYDDTIDTNQVACEDLSSDDSVDVPEIYDVKPQLTALGLEDLHGDDPSKDKDDADIRPETVEVTIEPNCYGTSSNDKDQLSAELAASGLVTLQQAFNGDNCVGNSSNYEVEPNSTASGLEYHNEDNCQAISGSDEDNIAALRLATLHQAFHGNSDNGTSSSDQDPANTDEVTSELAASGPTGVAAAAAITSGKRRKTHHKFETCPSIRKRQQKRLLAKLQEVVQEYAVRVGQQAIVLVAAPGPAYKVFGAKPLQDILHSLRSTVMEELDSALAHQTPLPVQADPALFELPPVVIEDLPTPVERLTQAQLRAFIPLMLKYSTGRGKPGWGNPSMRPEWWPNEDVPWANIRLDVRSEAAKRKLPWTDALRQIVYKCYEYHGREDLLPSMTEQPQPNDNNNNNDDNNNNNNERRTSTSDRRVLLHTITHPNGNVTLMHVDPNNPFIMLPDGTTAHVQGATALVAANEEHELVDLSQVTEATLNEQGQIVLQRADGQEIYIIL